MDEQLNKPPAPGLAEPVVIRQPQLDSSVPGPTSLRTVVVKRVHTKPEERDPFRTVAVGLTAIGLALLAAALGGTTLANIAAGSPADAITVVSPNLGQTPSVLADSDSGSISTDLDTKTPDGSNPSLANFIASAETSQPRADGSVAPTTAAPTTAAPATVPPPTAPPTTAATTTTTTPTTIAPTTVAATLPLTTVPATAPEPTELPLPSTSLSSTTTTDGSVDTKPGKGNSDDGPGKGNKPGKDN